jgi:ribosome-associated protein
MRDRVGTSFYRGRVDGILRITPSCSLRLDELQWRFDRAGGPGGQHANTSDTRAEVRFDVSASPSLGPRQRARLLERLGPVVTAAAGDSRSQARNRELALERLRTTLAEGLHVDAPRRPTRPSRAARGRRLDAKRKQAERKRDRRRPAGDD